MFSSKSVKAKADRDASEKKKAGKEKERVKVASKAATSSHTVYDDESEDDDYQPELKKKKDKKKDTVTLEVPRNIFSSLIKIKAFKDDICQTTSPCLDSKPSTKDLKGREKQRQIIQS